MHDSSILYLSSIAVVLIAVVAALIVTEEVVSLMGLLFILILPQPMIQIPSDEMILSETEIDEEESGGIGFTADID